MAGTVFFSVTMSLDGFIAPEERMDDPDVQRWMAQWMELQQWIFPQRFFRENLKLGEGGEEGRDNDIARETFERTGASVMGKRMFDLGEQAWPEAASALPRRGQQRGEILDALSVRKGERSGRNLGRALVREGPHGVVVELPRQLRLRQRVTKGPGSRAAGVAMAFKLIESAQTRWRAVNAPHLVALVRAGAVSKNGKLIERPGESEGGGQQVT
jgi:hypothetical protein